MTVKAVVFDLFKTLGEFSRVVTDEEVSTILQSNGYSVYLRHGDTPSTTPYS